MPSDPGRGQESRQKGEGFVKENRGIKETSSSLGQKDYLCMEYTPRNTLVNKESRPSAKGSKAQPTNFPKEQPQECHLRIDVLATTAVLKI